MIAGSIFFTSLFFITLLFTLKYWEDRAGRTLFPGIRAKADRQARILRLLIAWAAMQLSKIPPTAMLIVRYVVHQAALKAARLSRAAEKAAYDLADYVSHRHRFERRETKSQFLKEVSGHKNGSKNGETDGAKEGNSV